MTLPVFHEIASPDVPGDRCKIDPDLFQYTDRVSGQTHQHTTSIGRMMALARSHPLVVEGSTTLWLLRSSRDEQKKVDLDDEGRVTSGPSVVLSMSLVGSLKVFQVGLETGPGPELFALHWTTQGKDWTQDSWLAARNVFFDIIELDASHFLPAPPRQPEFHVSLSDESDSSDDEKKRPGSSTTSTSSESESESSGGDDEVLPEEEEQAGAASGALRGVKQQSELDATCHVRGGEERQGGARASEEGNPASGALPRHPMAGGIVHVAGGGGVRDRAAEAFAQVAFRAGEGVRNFSFGGGDPNRHLPPESSAP